MMFLLLFVFSTCADLFRHQSRAHNHFVRLQEQHFTVGNNILPPAPLYILGETESVFTAPPGFIFGLTSPNNFFLKTVQLMRQSKTSTKALSPDLLSLQTLFCTSALLQIQLGHPTHLCPLFHPVLKHGVSEPRESRK